MSKLGYLIKFIVACGSNATGFLRGAYEGASPRARGTLNETGGKVRVQDDGVCLLREGRIQSVRVRLDQLCSGRDFGFKRVQRACNVIQFEQGKNKQTAYSVSVALRASIALGSQPGAFSAKSIRERPMFQRRKKRFALVLELR